MSYLLPCEAVTQDSNLAIKVRSAKPQKLCLTLKFPERDQEAFASYYEELQAEKFALSIVKRAKDVKKGK